MYFDKLKQIYFRGKAAFLQYHAALLFNIKKKKNSVGFSFFFFIC
jgi:hypothetical protein